MLGGASQIVNVGKLGATNPLKMVSFAGPGDIDLNVPPGSKIRAEIFDIGDALQVMTC
ncbi:MAG: hypothetical protein RCG15_02875 [Candidatus Rickettsia vulgarisii]